MKYLEFTTGDGVELLAADAILYAESVSSTAAKIHLKNLSHHIAVVGTGLTSGFAENVNAALLNAAGTKWSDTVSVVNLNGMTVTSLTVTVFS